MVSANRFTREQFERTPTSPWLRSLEEQTDYLQPIVPFVRSRPVTALLVAAGIGCVLGCILLSQWSSDPRD